MGTDAGNWYKVIYNLNNQVQSAIVRAATPGAAVTAAVADVVGLLAANVIQVQSVDPQPVTINN